MNGDSSSQEGNYGIGHMSGGVIKDDAKVAGKIKENNNDQSQHTSIQLNLHVPPQTQSNIS